jgi:hypothetical protein
VNRGIESSERYILQGLLGHAGRSHRGFPARAAVSLRRMAPRGTWTFTVAASWFHC